MSFLSVLRSIGHVLQVATSVAVKASPAVAAVPVYGPAVIGILGAIQAAETLIPQAGAGAAKKTVVTTITNATAPGIDPATLSTVIDEIIAALNSLNTAFAKIEPAVPSA